MITSWFFSVARRIVLVLAFTLLWVPVPTLAQEEDSVLRLNSALERVDNEIKDIEIQISSPDVTDEQLSTFRRELQDIRQGLADISLKNKSQLDIAVQALQKLGPAPDADQPAESESIAEQRKILSENRADRDGIEKYVVLLDQQVEADLAEISSLRRKNFTQAILVKTSSPMSMDLLGQVGIDTKALIAQLGQVIRSYINFRINPNPFRALSALFLAVASLVIAYLVNRRWIVNIVKREVQDRSPSDLRVSIYALWHAVAPTFIWGAGAFIAYANLDQIAPLPPNIDAIIRALIWTLLGIYAVSRFLRKILAPVHSEWRPINIPDEAATKLRFYARWIAIIYSLDFFVSEVLAATSSPLSLTVAKAAITSLLIAGLLIRMLHTPIHPASRDKKFPRKGWPVWLYFPLWAIAVAMIGSTFLGYIGLGNFLARQVVVTIGVLMLIFLAHRVASAFSSPTVTDTFFARSLQNRLDIDEGTVEQLGMSIGLMIDFAVLLIGIPLILLQWGFDWNDVSSWVTSFLTGFRVGNIEIPLATIITGFVVFVLLVIVFRIFRRWLWDRFISRMRIDPGIRNSIYVGLGYLAIIVAAIISIAYAGLDLSSLAIIVGALSVGVGFGLQNIVNNFVSGIILLVERPMKVGDWVGVGEFQGFVKRINVRSTVLETLDKQSIVVPNADLINTAMTNWMLSDKEGRITVGVGVSYSSDVELVREILLKVASASPHVVSSPAPDVIFKDFGASSLDFELRVYVNDIAQVVPVSSDLRFAIRKAFVANHIEIPFPQRDLHLRSMVPLQSDSASDSDE